MKRTGLRGWGLASGSMAALLMLAACGSKPVSNNANYSAAISEDVDTGNMANAVPENAANAVAVDAEKAKADDTAVRARIDDIYASYEGRGDGDKTQTPDLRNSWAHALGPGGSLGYDPYCGCKDFDSAAFTHQVKAVQLDDDRAHVTVVVQTRANIAPRSIWYDLLRTPKGWLIDDMGGGDGNSLKAGFRATPSPSGNAAEETP